MPSPEPAPAPAPDPDSVPLGDLFLRTSRRVRQRWAASLTPWDLAPHHGRALRLVADLEPVRPGVLAEHLRIAPRSVTDVVDALERRGFVERHPDPGDRRATVLQLTAAGRAVRAAIDASRREESDDFFGRLSDRDQTALRAILLRLTTDDDATDAPAGAGAPASSTRQDNPDDDAAAKDRDR